MDDSRGAGVRIPPPLVFIFFILCALGLDWLCPLDIHFPLALAYSGLAITILGVMALLYLAMLFKRVNTNIEPWKSTSTIITTGIYAYSRNPIYLAFCTIPLGLGLFFSHVWLMLSVFPSCIAVYFLAIRAEEAYLTEKFADEYLAYLSRVRRWL
ncbi:methyltransferase family protein [Shewanella violacea]|uniref:methyltransferase family protein n=1 Tax=Shewanella violacea TaxID=60217 RepID=UPI000319561B|nr:isoprenylcysteine carboxylmethyltransferase family protein [Shewanella violacea]